MSTFPSKPRQTKLDQCFADSADTMPTVFSKNYGSNSADKSVVLLTSSCLEKIDNGCFKKKGGPQAA
jgi:hypothetical protein